MTMSVIKERYLEALLVGSERAAERVVEDALSGGVSPDHLFVDVIGDAMHGIGDRWAAGSVSVAQEHRASEIACDGLRRLVARFQSESPAGQRRTAHVACAEGERHAFGGRVVEALLKLDGWSTEFIGADVPFKGLIDYSCAKASVICISVTMPEYAVRLVENLEALDRRVPLVVGGQGTEDKTVADALESAGAHVSNDQMLFQSVRFAAELKKKEDPAKEVLRDIGFRIQELRKSKDLNQKDLAERARIDRSHLSAIENGRQNVTIAVLAQIAEAFGVSVYKLICSKQR